MSAITLFEPGEVAAMSSNGLTLGARAAGYDGGQQGSTAGLSAPSKGKFAEIGATGLNRFGRTGYIYEEFLRQLDGLNGRKTYKEMSMNDPIVGAVLYAIDKLIRNVTWRTEGKDPALVEFVEECRIDMSHTFADLLSEILSMLVYGWSYFEVCYKRRLGESNDPLKNSRYSDGKIGWRKIPIRSQDSLSQWQFADDGGVQAFIQMAPPSYQRVEIPIENSLLFRTTSHKNNPEGSSILRTAYRPWFFKKRIEEIEAIGMERDLAGLPVIYASAEVQAAYTPAVLQNIVRNIRRDEQEGALLPMLYDEKGNKMLELELLSTGGTRQFNITEVINRKNREIATSCLADFLLLGQTGVGSFALSNSKTDLFALSLGTYLTAIATVLNRYAIPRLLALNGITADPVQMPLFVPGDLQGANLAELGTYIQQLSGSGMPLFPDGGLEAHLRQVANLPAKPEGEGADVPVARPSSQPVPVPEQKKIPDVAPR